MNLVHVFFLSYTDGCNCIRVFRIKNVGNYHIQLVIGLEVPCQVYVVNSHVSLYNHPIGELLEAIWDYFRSNLCK